MNNVYTLNNQFDNSCSFSENTLWKFLKVLETEMQDVSHCLDLAQNHEPLEK